MLIGMDKGKEKENMKKFMTIWVGELISNIGSGMTAFALSVYVYQLTGSAGYVSLVTLLAYMPAILLGPIGGLLADRYDRRLMMILGDLFSGLGLLYMLVQIQLGNEGLAPILIGVTINSVFVALLDPSYKATVTDLLTEEEYAKASGMVQMAGNAKYLLSPAIAGVILGFADIRLILIIDITTLFVTIFCASTVRKTLPKAIERKKTGSFVAEFKEGMGVLFGNKGVLSLVFIMTIVCLFMGVIQTLTVPMVLAVSDAKIVGFMESLGAIGMLVGSVVISVLGIKKNYAGILEFSAVMCGVFVAFTGMKNHVVWITVMLFLFFATLPFMNTCADVLVRVSIPNELQGRVWGLISLLSQAGTVIAYATCGVLADYIFEPMFQEEGVLAGSIGRLIGTGTGRGIGFMLILSGIGIILVAILIGGNSSIRAIEKG